MLLNPDGSKYCPTGTLRQFNPGPNNQLKLFDLWDQAAIEQGGSPIYYYEVFISSGEIDEDYIEARGKIFSEQPVELWATYDPLASQNYQNQWGLDSLNDMVFELNAKAVINKVGHMPKIGSRIHTPHLGEDWQIVQRNLGEFKLWGALRLQLICQQFQESTTTSDGKVTENSPNIPKPI